MKKLLPLFLFLFFQLQHLCAQDINLWGMTDMGPFNNDTVGIIFEFDPANNSFNDFHNFGSGTDGYQPWGSLYKALDGKLYGMTFNGGTDTSNGVIFSYNPVDSGYNVLFNFGSDTLLDGAQPTGSLIQADDGKLYGLTSGGIVFPGIMFSFDPVTLTYKVIHSFGASAGDGYFPNESLIIANGKLYGTTTVGGSGDAGIIFSYDPVDTLYTIVHSFGSGSDGSYPNADVYQAVDGKLYGMTNAGGTTDDGVLYSYAITNSTYKILHNFGNGSDGSSPFGDVVEVNNTLYGTTQLGGVNSEGMIFSYGISDSVYTDVHDFNSATDGSYPMGTLLPASDGKLYGMTTQGGADNNGTTFSLDPSNNTYADIHDFGSNGTAGRFIWWGNNLIEDNIYTGVNQLAINDNRVLVYPNPSDGEVNIYSSKIIDEIKVTNLLGQVVYEVQPHQMQFMLQLNSNGIYFVTVTTDKEVVSKKIVVNE